MPITRDENLYFSTEGPVTIHAPQPISCPLGQVIYAGTKWNSRATYAHAPAPDYLRPTPHYLLVYTLEGEADYRDETGVRTVMGTGSLMWSLPGINQSYGPRKGSRWSEFFMWFSGPVFDAWKKAGFPGSQSRHLRLTPVEFWLRRFMDIVTPQKGSTQETPLTRICAFQALLAEAIHFDGLAMETVEHLAWKKEACQRLQEGTLTSPTLDEVAHAMHVSYPLFRRRFLALTGTTPGHFRTGEIMRRASTRLLESSDTIGQIAQTYGFHDAFHFSRRFKEMQGMTPSDFRRQVHPHAKPRKRTAHADAR